MSNYDTTFELISKSKPYWALFCQPFPAVVCVIMIMTMHLSCNDHSNNDGILSPIGTQVFAFHVFMSIHLDPRNHQLIKMIQTRSIHESEL